MINVTSTSVLLAKGKSYKINDGPKYFFKLLNGVNFFLRDIILLDSSVPKFFFYLIYIFIFLKKTEYIYELLNFFEKNIHMRGSLNNIFLSMIKVYFSFSILNEKDLGLQKNISKNFL
jgi:hypothetical protein